MIAAWAYEYKAPEVPSMLASTAAANLLMVITASGLILLALIN